MYHGNDYDYTECLIEGHRYGSISGLTHRRQSECYIIDNFAVQAGISLFEQSTETKTKEFAKELKDIYAYHRHANEPIDLTPLYAIMKSCEERSFRTQIGSAEREFLLIACMNDIKKAYKF